MSFSNIVTIRKYWKRFKSVRIYAGPIDCSAGVIERELCRKHEIWLGVFERDGYDDLYIVMYGLYIIVHLKGKFDDLDLSQLQALYLIPQSDQHCDVCGEFSPLLVTINGKKFCCDCAKKENVEDEFKKHIIVPILSRWDFDECYLLGELMS